MKTLKTFQGFVYKIDDDIAYFNLVAEGETWFVGYHSAERFREAGIEERRRFILETVEVDGEEEIRLTAIPDIEVTEDEEREIDRRIERIVSEEQE